MPRRLCSAPLDRACTCDDDDDDGGGLGGVTRRPRRCDGSGDGALTVPSSNSVATPHASSPTGKHFDTHAAGDVDAAAAECARITRGAVARIGGSRSPPVKRRCVDDAH
jgi:hypothetical protein